MLSILYCLLKTMITLEYLGYTPGKTIRFKVQTKLNIKLNSDRIFK